MNGTGRITTAGLGSCVGLVVYDDDLDVAGMVHIMLPSSSKPDPLYPPKYANTAIPWLVESLLALGANPRKLRAKYAGGAQMFKNLHSDAMRIGERNVESVATVLANLAIPVIATDVGGNMGRTVHFELPSRVFRIRTARGEDGQI